MFDKQKFLRDIYVKENNGTIKEAIKNLLEDIKLFQEKNLDNKEIPDALEALKILIKNKKYTSEAKYLIEKLESSAINPSEYDRFIRIAINNNADDILVRLLTSYKNAGYTLFRIILPFRVKHSDNDNTFYPTLVYMELKNSLQWFLKTSKEEARNLIYRSEEYIFPYIRSIEMVDLLEENDLNFSNLSNISYDFLNEDNEKIFLNLLKINKELLKYVLNDDEILEKALRYDHKNLITFLTENNIHINKNNIPIYLIRSEEMFKIIWDGNYNDTWVTQLFGDILNNKPYKDYCKLTGKITTKPEKIYLPALKFLNNLIKEDKIDVDSLKIKLKKNHNLSGITILVGRHNLKDLQKIILKKLLEYLRPYEIFNSMLHCIQNNNKKNLEIIINNEKLPKETIEKFAEYCIKGLDVKYFDLLMKKKSVILKDNDFITKNLHQVTLPEIAARLIGLGYQFDGAQLKILRLTATIQKDTHSLSVINNRLGKPVEETDLRWHYSNKTNNTLISHESKKLLKAAYGSGVSQQKYKEYQQKCVDILLSHFIAKTFDLSNNINLIDRCNKLSKELGYLWPVRRPKIEADLTKHDGFQIDFYKIGKLRQWIALTSGGENYKEFGRIRIPNFPSNFSLFRTPLAGRYKKYLDMFIKEIAPKYKKNSNLINYYFIHINGYIAPKATFSSNIEGKSINLTRYDLFRNQGLHWLHTDPNKLPTLIRHVNKLINSILQLNIDHSNTEDSKKLIKKIGKLHWWLSQASFYERGSAAITEIIIMALVKHHGFNINWKEQADCYALIYPDVNDFAKEYHTLLGTFKAIPKTIKNKTPLLEISNLFSNKHTPLVSGCQPSEEKTQSMLKFVK